MSRERILVVDDEPDIRDIVREILEDEGYSAVTAENAETGRECKLRDDFDLVLLDIWMPGTDGITLLKEWADGGVPDIPVVMISGHGNVETAVEAIRFGAYDFLEKPLSTAKLLVTVKRALQDSRLRRENLELKGRLALASELVGRSELMSSLRDRIERVARTDSWVLITGEPGSGKGVVARVLHQKSPRRDKPFIELSLGATPSASVSNQLFGSEVDNTVHRGTLEDANGGTLVLDEIADIDLDVQGKLVSAIEERRFLRVGGRTPIEFDVRIIATSNQDLLALVRDGRFREDLYYRLNVVPMQVPALREHVEDVPELVEYYVRWLVDRDDLPYRNFSTGAMNVLRNYDWPGNVRELRNLVQRLLILNRGEEINAEEARIAIGGSMMEREINYSDSVFELPLKEARDQFERAYLNHHLSRVGGNVSELAQVIGMERTHLYRKLKNLGIDPKQAKQT
ncbi:MAG: sigma-54 dependent transcriptional regulator [Gammaproteobacteria bacterium]|nr:sigma-54 dependent transcriptional regulator [Gammaproteobacteria bacterium]